MITLAAILLLSGCTSVTVDHCPVISDLAASTEKTRPLQTCQITCIASDLDGDVLSYRWASNRGDISGEGPVVNWTAPSVAGIYTVTVSVDDGKGNQAVAYLNIEVSENHPPAIQSLDIEGSEVVVSQLHQVKCIASDPDGDELCYEWSISGGNISGEGQVVNWTAPDNTGSYTIAVKVSDGQGGEDIASLDVEVLAVNNPPEIARITVMNKINEPMERGKVLKGYEYWIECSARDPDGDRLTYDWQVTDGRILEQKRNKILWRAPDEETKVTIGVTVVDERLAEVKEAITLKVVTTTCQLYS